jgi:hypothetical protein
LGKVKETYGKDLFDTDNNRFFQVDIPAGYYSIAIIENGKLYANTREGQGGLCPFIFQQEHNTLI